VVLDFQRFGSALVDEGSLNLKLKKFAQDFSPIDEECDCSTCRRHTRAFLHSVVTVEPSACHLVTVHNVAYQVSAFFARSLFPVSFIFAVSKPSSW
jgi:queuine tRNA-ribosyltransferase